MPKLSRFQRLWYFFEQQRRNVRLRQKTVIDTSDKTVEFFGDSRVAQYNSTATVTENVSFISFLQMVTGYRYNVINSGVSGDRTSHMVARLSSIQSSASQIVVFLGGINDRRNKDTAAATIANYTTIINGLRSAGKKMIFITDMPCLDTVYSGLGFTSAEITQAKADQLTANNFLKSQASADLEIADGYAEFYDTGTGQGKSAYYLADGLHPNATGGLKNGILLDSLLTPKYGIRSFTVNANNKLSNTNYTGIGGTVSNATGQLADNHLVIGTAPTGTTSRTLSKATGQVMAFNFPSGGSTRDNFRVLQRSTANYAGQSAYGEIEFRITDTGAGAGIWNALSLELMSSAGSMAIGCDRATVTDLIPVAELKAFCDAKNRTLMIRTPSAVVPSSTYVENRMQLECNTTGGARSGAIELLNEQLVVV